MRCSLLTWMVLLLPALHPTLSPHPAAAQRPPDAAEEPDESVSLPDAESISVEAIEAALKEVAELAELSDDEKAQLKESLNQAKAMLASATLDSKEAAKLQAWIDSAADDIESTTKQRESLTGYDFDSTASREVNQLNADRTELEQRLADAKKALADAQTEPQRRVDRRSALPNELSTAKDSLSKTEDGIKAIRSGDSASIKARAKLMLLEATLRRQTATIQKLENEREAYEAQGELPRLQIDLLTASVKQLEQDILQLVDIITERRRIDAAEQKKRAEAALAQASDTLKPLAQENVDLTNRRLELATSIRDAAALRDKINHQLTRWTDDFEKTKKRTDTVESSTIGLTLVKKRSELPSVSLLRRSIEEGNDALAIVQLELYELEERRSELADISAAVDRAGKDLRKEGAVVTEETERQLKTLFAEETQILDSLLNDANRHYTLQLATREAQTELIDVIDEFKEYIDRHVFWSRTTRPLQPDHAVVSGRALAWLVNVDSINAAVANVGSRLLHQPLELLLLIAFVAALLFYRPKLRQRLEEFGEVAKKISCRSMVPTVRAIAVTVMLALPGPAIFWIISWAFSDSTSAPVRAAAHAFSRAGIWWFIFETIRKLWTLHGLAENHFGWPITRRHETNRGLKILIAAGIPLYLLGSVFQQHGDPEFQASISRICMIALLTLVAWVAWRVFGEQARFRREDEYEKSEGFSKKCMRFLSRLMVIVPVMLAVASASGFHYAATELTIDCLLTFAVVYALVVLQATLFRWVRVARRRIRWQQLVDAQQQRSEADEQSESSEVSPASDISALVAKEEETDLVSMDRQMQRLITLVVVSIGVVSLAGIWREVLPALTPIIDLPINPMNDPDVTEPITVGALLIAMAITIVTIAGWRNIPGLIDVLLLGRLGVESSIRYAITTLSQYGIGIVGIIFACKALGMTWGSVQWLVAAMGVGLGFGLQEVVANFVCGVILLFERPIRVGDIVTLGDTTGVVVRIRSRATTVRNWDRQEVVIPNKELITGRITNWTLSDDMNRIVMQVGIAYGSDTDHARNLLFEILADHPHIIDDPRPLVTFEQFGDSTLNLIIRAYLDKMDERLETVHQLHSTIHQRFNEEGIEIAFPQQDLHLRSVDPAVQLPGSPDAAQWGGTSQAPES